MSFSSSVGAACLRRFVATQNISLLRNFAPLLRRDYKHATPTELLKRCQSSFPGCETFKLARVWSNIELTKTRHESSLEGQIKFRRFLSSLPSLSSVLLT